MRPAPLTFARADMGRRWGGRAATPPMAIMRGGTRAEVGRGGKVGCRGTKRPSTRFGGALPARLADEAQRADCAPLRPLAPPYAAAPPPELRTAECGRAEAPAMLEDGGRSRPAELKGRPSPLGRAEPERCCGGGGGGPAAAGALAGGGPSVSGFSSSCRCSAAPLGSRTETSHVGMRTPPRSTALSLLNSSASRRAVEGTMPSRASPAADILITSVSFMPRSNGVSWVNSSPPTNCSHRKSDRGRCKAVSSRVSSTLNGGMCASLAAEPAVSARRPGRVGLNRVERTSRMKGFFERAHTTSLDLQIVRCSPSPHACVHACARTQ